MLERKKRDECLEVDARRMAFGGFLYREEKKSNVGK